MSHEWTVTVDYATEEPLDEEQLIALADLAAQHWDGTIAARGADGPGFLLILDTLDIGVTAAVEHGTEAALKLAGELSLFGENAGAAATSPEVAAERATRPDTPELLAATDVALLLGVSRQRVHQLATENPQFPAPYARLGSGPIWTRPAIEQFAQVWERRAGRPTKASRAGRT